MKNKKKESFFNKLSLFGFSISGALAGIILIIISLKFDASWSEAMQIIGQSVTSISLSSILIEWFGYVNYTRNRMSEILVEDEVLKILDMKRKRELKSALIHNIYMPNTDLEKNNIATIVDDEMDNVLKGYYYDEYISYTDIYKIKADDSEEEFIKKDVRVTFTAKSVKGDKCILDTLLSMCIEPVASASLKPVELKKLLVNENDITDEFKGDLEETENTADLKDTYSKMYLLNRKTQKNKFKKHMSFTDTIYIDMEYSTIVGADDLLYSHQIDKACKHYCAHFNVKSDEYEMIVMGFGFMSLGYKAGILGSSCAEMKAFEILFFIIVRTYGCCLFILMLYYMYERKPYTFKDLRL